MGQATDQYTAVVTAAGTATITIAPKKGQVWKIQQIGTELAGANAGATADVRLNRFLLTPLVAAADAAAGDPPIYMRGGVDILTINWYSATPALNAAALVVYDDVTGSPAALAKPS